MGVAKRVQARLLWKHGDLGLGRVWCLDLNPKLGSKVVSKHTKQQTLYDTQEKGTHAGRIVSSKITKVCWRELLKFGDVGNKG